ncbi:MAG: hypothetical protein QOH27_1919, partial [Mycobacterium sp.]|nr:hypothetical protein [Mycobacterium sp.]
MVSSAMYRYVASRDDLLTLLLVDAYTELADRVDDARAANERAAWTEQLVAMARAARQWAMAEPASWALLYGSPVPGYAAPQDTIGPASRPVWVLVGILRDGVERDVLSGALRLPRAVRQ